MRYFFFGVPFSNSTIASYLIFNFLSLTLCALVVNQCHSYPNGNMLLEMASEKSLCIVNTIFEKREGKRWSYEGPKGDRHLIDYILVNSKWINSVKNAEAYSSFASVGSNHRIVTMIVILSLRVTIPPMSKKSYDWKLLRSDHDLQSSFKIVLRNRFSQLYVEEASATDQYTMLSLWQTKMQRKNK